MCIARKTIAERSVSRVELIFMCIETRYGLGLSMADRPKQNSKALVKVRGLWARGSMSHPAY